MGFQKAELVIVCAVNFDNPERKVQMNDTSRRLAAGLVAIFVVRVECSAQDSVARVAKQQERNTISVGLEFTKKNRSPVLRALAALGTVTPNAYASGFLVGDGLVMTNYHVVSGQLSLSKKRKLGFEASDELDVKVYINGCQARTVKVDEVADLALLRLCTQSKQAKRATFGSAPADGAQLLLIAQPGDYKIMRRGSFHGTYDFGGHQYWSMRIDGQDGFSGSPVYDSKGEIVGVFCRYDWQRGIALISPASEAQKLLADYGAATQSQP